MEILDTHQASIQLNLKTEFADKINDTNDVVFNFATPIHCDKGNRLLLSLEDFSCPLVYYLINTNNQSLSFVLDDVDYEIIIPVGNYDILTLKKKIISLWDHATINLNIVINTESMKYTFVFTRTGNTNIFSVVLNDTKILKILGMVSSTVNSVLFVGDTFATLTSQHVVNFQKTKSIHIKSNTFNIDYLNSYGVSDGTIASIHINNNRHGDNVYFKNTSKIKFLLSVTRIKHLHLYLVDDDGEKLQLNNHNWSVSFELNFIKQRVADIEEKEILE